MVQPRLLLDWCLIAVIALVVACGLGLAGATARVDNAIYDELVHLRAPSPSDRILIVAIDDASVAAIGRWPWNREIHADALDRIASAAPAAVAYDVIFTEPASSPREDARLAAALRHGKVALPLLLQAPGTNGSAFDVTPPIAPLSSAAAALGHVALPHEPDGSARVALLAIDRAGRTWPHLAEQAYRLATGHPSHAFRRAEGRMDYGVFVPYAPAGAFRTVPFKDVLSGSVPAELLRDRIILVGATAGGLGDRHSVSGAGNMPGVEVQANLVNSLLADRFVQTPSLGWRLALAALPSMILLLLFLRLRPSRALLSSFVIFTATATTPLVLLVVGGIWLPPVSALIALLIVYPLWGWRRLHAIHRAMSDELARFADESGVPLTGARAGLDPAGHSVVALSASIARLRDIKQFVADTVEGVGDPLIVIGLSSELLLANGGAKALFDAGLELSVIARRLDEPLQNDLVLPDGRSFSPRATPLTDAAGEPRGWILLLAEITAIRVAEQDREEALEFLSHDMRSPQAAIIAMLETESDRSVPAEFARRLGAHARHTLRLADDFVQLARLRNASFEPEETDLCDSLAEACDAVWPLAARRGVKLVLEGEEMSRCVLGEHHALTRAVLNLLDNAIKFSPDSAMVRCSVAETVDENGRWYDLAVEDAGPGISPDHLSRLFSRFGPVGRNVSGMIAGSGLGLSYVRAAAERHGGSLAYAPVATGGSRFTMRLPAPELSTRDCDAG